MTNPLGRALAIWLVVRTALATVVLGLATTIFIPTVEAPFGATPLYLLGIVALAITSSFVVASAVVRGAAQKRLATVLLVLDIAEVTMAVAVTGGAASVLSVLYGAVILASATTIGSRASFIAGGLSLASYSVISLGMAWGVILPPADQLPTQYALSPQDLVFSVMSNATAMMIVTLLSSALATQLSRAGGALAESEQDRLRLSALYADIVRSIGSGILTTDVGGKVTSANPAAEELLRTTSAAVVGRPLEEFFPDLGSTSTGVDERAEMRAVRTNGSEFPAGFSIARLAPPNASERAGQLIAFQDLTEIRRLETAARESERLAILGRVAATLAHEIRNPLSSISGCVELVREGVAGSEENAQLLSLIVREVERLDELVEAMLDVARRREPRFQPFDVAALARDVCVMASAGLGLDAKVVAREGTDRPLVLVADASMIHQILWNLVKNAVQSSGDHATVEIAIGREETSTFLEVRDRGPGIPEADRAKIFDAFHTGRTRGVGLGLALVRQLVLAHGGEIRVGPRDAGTGAAFRVLIPSIAETPTSRDSLPIDSGRGGA